MKPSKFVCTIILFSAAIAMLIIALLIMEHQGEKVLFELFGVWMDDAGMSAVSSFTSFVLYIFSNAAFWLMGAAIAGLISRKHGLPKYFAGLTIGSIAAPFLFPTLYSLINPHNTNRCGGWIMCGECNHRFSYTISELFICVPATVIFGITFLVALSLKIKKEEAAEQSSTNTTE